MNMGAGDCEALPTGDRAGLPTGHRSHLGRFMFGSRLRLVKH
ncbi:hypothetical protein [Cylindrospermopsis raciborskii]|nr:hypothetical protein [Cylindrospermopsis raciborskii]